MHGAGAATFDGDAYLMPGSVRAGSVQNPGRVQVLDVADDQAIAR